MTLGDQVLELYISRSQACIALAGGVIAYGVWGGRKYVLQVLWVLQLRLTY